MSLLLEIVMLIHVSWCGRFFYMLNYLHSLLSFACELERLKTNTWIYVISLLTIFGYYTKLFHVSDSLFLFLTAVLIFYLINYFLSDSETTKNVLILSTYIHLKCNKIEKFASDLPTLCPRILLSGPAGNGALHICFICVSTSALLFPTKNDFPFFFSRFGNISGDIDQGACKAFWCWTSYC